MSNIGILMMMMSLFRVVVFVVSSSYSSSLLLFFINFVAIIYYHYSSYYILGERDYLFSYYYPLINNNELYLLFCFFSYSWLLFVPPPDGLHASGGEGEVHWPQQTIRSPHPTRWIGAKARLFVVHGEREPPVAVRGGEGCGSH